MIVKPDMQPRVRRSGCFVNDTGLPKATFANSREAKRARLALLSHGAVEPISAYRCSACNSWHVGRDPRRWWRQ